MCGWPDGCAVHAVHTHIGRGVVGSLGLHTPRPLGSLRVHNREMGRGEGGQVVKMAPGVSFPWKKAKRVIGERAFLIVATKSKA